MWRLYEGGADSHRLAEACYAHGSATKIDGHHPAIELVYEDRDDDVTGYVAGHEFSSRKRLAKVRTLSHDGAALKVVRELRLAYRNTARALDRTSCLTSIAECAGEDGKDEDNMPATRRATWFAPPAVTMRSLHTPIAHGHLASNSSPTSTENPSSYADSALCPRPKAPCSS